MWMHNSAAKDTCSQTGSERRNGLQDKKVNGMQWGHEWMKSEIEER